MKKKITILLCILVSLCQAQTLKVSYLEKINLADSPKIDVSQIQGAEMSPGLEAMVQKMIEEQNKKNSEGKEYELYSVNGESIYQKTEVKEVENEAITTITLNEKDIFYRNFKDKQITNQTSILSKTFLINEDEKSFDWQISDQTEMIGTYKCKKATSLSEEGLVAWFTNEVPISTGPRQYYGLPGLIVKLTLGTLTIEAIDVKIMDEIVAIEKPTKGKNVSRKKYNEIRDEKLNLNDNNNNNEGIRVKMIEI